jgi:hypothetical protein
MPRKNELEFANFILRFGENHTLLDFAEEIVIPAFMSELIRPGGHAEHFFQDVHLLNLGNENEPVLSITGRYIKDTTISRDQVYNNSTDELLKDQAKMRTSPSAIFSLILNNHRLLYFGESRNAPGIQSFQTTIRYFLKASYQDYIDRLCREREISKRELYRNYSPPNLEIIPLSDVTDITEFIGGCDLVRTAQIELITTNNETDNEGFFENFRKSKEDANSDLTIIRHHNSKGLSKPAVAKQIKSAVTQGNARFKVKGQDADGNRLEGSNENFKIRVQIDNPPVTLDGVVRKCYQQFEILRASHYIRTGEFIDNVRGKIMQIFQNRQP